MNETPALTQGVHHVGLTVPDVEETGQFLIEVFGYQQVGSKPDYPAVLLSDGSGLITLWQVQDSLHLIPFNHRDVVGLHHLALKVDASDLDPLCARLKEVDGVSIEFEPELLGDGPTRHMMFFIPGGIRMELIAPIT
jgi:catechol 2,3-dioxygenase-like lactoylglutathione lyase family enzyme